MTDQAIKQQSSNTLAIVKRDTIDVVAKKVREFQQHGEIQFPANYSPENAMKSAWLTLQKMVDKNKRPVLEVCTKSSIANALLNMVIQGLNPAKQQGYFIAYSNKLFFQRSYFGTIASTKMLTGAKDIIAQIVYDDDIFDYEFDKKGCKHIIRHEQILDNIGNNNIRAAYCNIIWPDEYTFLDIMTWDQIKQSWKQSKSKPILESGLISSDSTHGMFTIDMALKTVINHACKYYVNTSNDSGLMIEQIRQFDKEIDAARLESEIEENANKGEILELDEIDDDQFNEDVKSKNE